MGDQRETRTAAERDVTHLPARRGVRCSCGVFIPEGEQHPPIVTAGAQPPRQHDILWDDIAAVLTVYEEHVAPENRGPWYDRLSHELNRRRGSLDPTPEDEAFDRGWRLARSIWEATDG